MKKIFLVSIFAFSLACSGGGVHSGSTYSGDVITSRLDENLLNSRVTAVITLVGGPSHDAAEVEVEGMVNGFYENEVQYQPRRFGDIPCTVRFYSGGHLVQTVEDTIRLYVETAYIGVGGEYESTMKIAPIPEGYDGWYYPQNISIGNYDRSLVYSVRVPDGENLIFTWSSLHAADGTPNWGDAAIAMHYRLWDYDDRRDAYEDPDLYWKTIDPEPEKWIMAPATVSNYAGPVYVCPNAPADRSQLNSVHAGLFSGVVRVMTDNPVY